METKTTLRKRKKAYLLDMFREAYPFKSERYYQSFTKEEIITKLLDAQKYE
jgi:hypothetical protein